MDTQMYVYRLYARLKGDTMDLHLYVYMYIHIYMYMYIQALCASKGLDTMETLDVLTSLPEIHTQTCTHAYTCIFMRLLERLGTYINIYIYIYIHKYAHMHIHVYIIRIFVYIYIYAYSCICSRD